VEQFKFNVPNRPLFDVGQDRCLARPKFSSSPRIPRGMLSPFPLESTRPFVALMKKIIVAVGSTRKPKLRAVMKALDAFAPKLVPDGDFEVVGVDVESGVSPTPTSCEELMRGARQRVEALVQMARETRKTWRYFVGLEGGLEVLQDDRSRRVFLESWAYVSDGILGFYGRSGGIELTGPRSSGARLRPGGCRRSICGCGRHSRRAGRLGRALGRFDPAGRIFSSCGHHGVRAPL